MNHPARRFLAPQARAGNGHGYLTQPQRPQPHPGAANMPELRIEADRVLERSRMCDEPEAVGPAIVDAYGELARTYDEIRHARETEERQQARQLLTAEQRLKDAQARAKRQHVNLTREFHAISQLLDRARRGNRHDPPSAIRMLERAESKLDPPAAA